MRQTGVLTAMCLYALDHHVERLAEDHSRAKRIEAALRGVGSFHECSQWKQILCWPRYHPSVGSTQLS